MLSKPSKSQISLPAKTRETYPWNPKMIPNDFRPSDADTRFAQRRAVPRYPFVAPAEIFDPIPRIHLDGQLLQISLRGCYFATLNHSVIQLQVRQDHETFEAMGRVARVEIGKGMGIAFNTLAARMDRRFRT